MDETPLNEAADWSNTATSTPTGNVALDSGNEQVPEDQLLNEAQQQLTSNPQDARADRAAASAQKLAYKVKGEDLARRGIGYYTDLNSGEPKPLTDSTGSAITNFDKTTSVGYDSQGNPQKLTFNAQSGEPQLKNPYDDAKPFTDPKTGMVYKAPKGLPWQYDGTDQATTDQLQQTQQAKLEQQTASALTTPVAMARQNLTTAQQVANDSSKATANKLQGLGVPLVDGQGNEIDVDGDPAALKGHIENSFNQEYASPAANDKPLWGGDLTQSAQALRSDIERRKQSAMQAVDQHATNLDNVTQAAQQFDQTRAPVAAANVAKIQRLNEQRQAAGMPPVPIPQELQRIASLFNPPAQIPGLAQQPAGIPGIDHSQALNSGMPPAPEVPVAAPIQTPTDAPQHPAAALWERTKNFLGSVISGATDAIGEVARSPVFQHLNPIAATTALVDSLAGSHLTQYASGSKEGISKFEGVITDPAFHDNGEAKAGRFIGGVIPYVAQAAFAAPTMIPTLFSAGYQGQYEAAKEKFEQNAASNPEAPRDLDAENDKALKAGILGGGINAILGIPFKGAGKVVANLFGDASVPTVKAALEAAYDRAGGAGVANELGALRAAISRIGFAQDVPAALKEAVGNGLDGIIKEIQATGLQRAGQVAKHSAIDAATFGAAQAGQNVVAQNTYDPDRPTGEGVGEAALGGAAMGAVFGGVDQAVKSKRAEQARTDIASVLAKQGQHAEPPPEVAGTATSSPATPTEPARPPSWGSEHAQEPAAPSNVADVQKAVMAGQMSHSAATDKLIALGLHPDDVVRAIGPAPAEPSSPAVAAETQGDVNAGAGNAAGESLLSDAEVQQAAKNLGLPAEEISAAAKLPLPELQARQKQAMDDYDAAVAAGKSNAEIAQAGLDTRAGLYQNLTERASRAKPSEDETSSTPTPIPNVAPSVEDQIAQTQRDITDATALRDKAASEGNGMAVALHGKDLADAKNRLAVLQSSSSEGAEPPAPFAAARKGPVAPGAPEASRFQVNPSSASRADNTKGSLGGFEIHDDQEHGDVLVRKHDSERWDAFPNRSAAEEAIRKFNSNETHGFWDGASTNNVSAETALAQAREDLETQTRSLEEQRQKGDQTGIHFFTHAVEGLNRKIAELEPESDKPPSQPEAIAPERKAAADAPEAGQSVPEIPGIPHETPPPVSPEPKAEASGVEASHGEFKQRMHRGTPSYSGTADTSENQELGPGKYWADDPEVAQYFTGGEDKSKITSGDVHLKTPLNLLGDWRKTPQFQALSKLLGDKLPKWSDEKWNDRENPYNVLAHAAGGKTELAKLLRTAGYDGIVNRGIGGFGDLHVQAVELPEYKTITTTEQPGQAAPATHAENPEPVTQENAPASEGATGKTESKLTENVGGNETLAGGGAGRAIKHANHAENALNKIANSRSEEIDGLLTSISVGLNPTAAMWINKETGDIKYDKENLFRHSKTLQDRGIDPRTYMDSIISHELIHQRQLLLHPDDGENSEFKKHYTALWGSVPFTTRELVLDALQKTNNKGIFNPRTGKLLPEHAGAELERMAIEQQEYGRTSEEVMGLNIGTVKDITSLKGLLASEGSPKLENSIAEVSTLIVQKHEPAAAAKPPEEAAATPPTGPESARGPPTEATSESKAEAPDALHSGTPPEPISPLPKGGILAELRDGNSTASRPQESLAKSISDHIAGSEPTGRRAPDSGGAVTADERERQKQSLAEWAKANGRAVTRLPFSFNSPNNKGGVEHDAWFDQPSQRWLKVTKPSFGLFPQVKNGSWSLGPTSVQQYLQKLEGTRELFGLDTAIHGAFLDPRGNPSLIVSQQHIPGAVDDAKIERNLRAAGFLKVDDLSSTYYRPSDNTMIFDAHPGNGGEINGKLTGFDMGVIHPEGELRQLIEADHAKAMRRQPAPTGGSFMDAARGALQAGEPPSEPDTKRLRQLYLIASKRALNPKEQSERDGITGALHAGAPPEPFYSQLTRAIQALPQETMTVGQAKAAITKGAKPAEIKQQGILDDPLSPLFGRAETDKVSKSDLVGYTLERQARVSDVTLGSEQSVSPALKTWLDTEGKPVPVIADNWMKISEKLEREAQRWQKNGDPAKANRIFTLSEEANRHAEGINANTGSTSGETHFSQYQLPGADEGSYREQFVTWPDNASGFKYVTDNSNEGMGRTTVFDPRGTNMGTWATRQSALASQRRQAGNWEDGHGQYSDIANPIVRIRRNIRTMPDGSKTFFVEEMQGPGKSEQEKMPPELQKRIYEIGMKRAVRDAVDEGADRLAWTTGDQQAERYDLSKQVDRVTFNKSPSKPEPGKIYMAVFRDDAGHAILNGMFTPAEIEDQVGKEIAQKIVDGGDYGTLRGLDLKVGGEGLKRLYDQTLPRIANELAKKTGAKVGTSEIPGAGKTAQDSTTGERFAPKGTSENVTVHSLEIPQQWKNEAPSFALYAGQPPTDDGKPKEAEQTQPGKESPSVSQPPHTSKGASEEPATTEKQTPAQILAQQADDAKLPYSMETLKGLVREDPKALDKVRQTLRDHGHEPLAAGAPPEPGELHHSQSQPRKEDGSFQDDETALKRLGKTFGNLREKSGLASLVDDIQKVFSPDDRLTDAERERFLKTGDPNAIGDARKTSIFLDGFTAELARQRQQWSRDLAESMRLVDKLPEDGPAGQRELSMRIDEGTPLKAGPYKDMLDKWRDIDRAHLDQVKADFENLGLEHWQNFENYEKYIVPHQFEDQKAADKVLDSLIKQKKRVAGGTSWLKHRQGVTIREMVEHAASQGITLQTRHANPIRAGLDRWTQQARYIGAHKLMQQMVNAGILHWEGTDYQGKPGEQMVNNIIGQRTAMVDGHPRKQYAWGNEQSANIVNNYLSIGLRQGHKWVDNYFKVANMLNGAQLGFSFFHGGFVTVEGMVSNFALGLQKLASGDMSGLKNIATSPFSTWHDWKLGRKIRNEMLNPGTNGDVMKQVVDSIVSAGFRDGLDSFYDDNHVTKFLADFRNGKMVPAALRAPFAAVEAIASPLMKHFVPAIKAAVIYKLADMHLKQSPDIDPMELRRRLQEDVRSGNNRLGQMTYDNLHLHKASKDLMMGATRSLGWNWGTFAEIGGGIGDWARFIPNAAKAAAGKGAMPRVTNKMAYTLALPILVGALGAAMSSLFGQKPEQLKDYYFVKTGDLDEKGQPIRVALPSYMKDVFHAAKDPASTITNKLHPLLSTLGDMLRNKDFYGTEIRHAGDPVMKQILQELGYAAKQFTPFTARNAAKLHAAKAPLILQAGGLVGITQAPDDVNKSDAQNLADRITRESMPTRARTSEEAVASQLRGRLIATVRQGNQAELSTALRNGQITPKQATAIQHAATMTPLQLAVSHMDLNNAQRVFEKATPEERRQLQPLIAKKQNTTSNQLAGTTRGPIYSFK